jgi:hypothetical protein
VQQQVLGGGWPGVELPVGTIQHECCCHPAAVGLAAHCKVLKVDHNHLLLLLGLGLGLHGSIAAC